MSDQSNDHAVSQAGQPVQGTADTQATMATATSGEPEIQVKASFLLLMVYAMLFGAVFGLVAAAFLTIYDLGVKFFQEPSHFGLNIGQFWPLVLLTVGGLLLGLAIKFTGQHGGLGVPQRQYAETGRIQYRYLPSIMLEALISLFSGAAVGPEAPLAFLGGGLGSLIADHLGLEKDDVPILVYSAVAGVFGAFFGNPLVGMIVSLEYMFIHQARYMRLLIPGFLAASFGFATYWAVLHTSLLGIIVLPKYPAPRLQDLGWAIVIGLLCGVIGTLFKVIFGIVHLVFTPLKKRPVICAVVGGVVIGLIGSFLPLTLYSGQEQIQSIINNPAAYSVGFLLLLCLVKILLTSTSFATGFDGGPVFPFIFMGGTLGLAIHGIFAFIPESVGVTAAMAGITSALFPIPLSMVLLLGLMGGQPDLLPVIGIGAIFGFLTSRALAPLLPKRRTSSASSGEATTPATPAVASTGEAETT
jgi:H+/Cl- antiporter ClcA